MISVVKKAIKMIEDPDELAKCRETYTEARARLAIIVCLTSSASVTSAILRYILNIS